MKIAYLVHDTHPDTGGGRYAASIIQTMEALGHKVLVLTESGDGHLGSGVLRRGWKLFFCIYKVRKLLQDCDIVHAIDGYPYGVIAWLANRTLGKRLIISALGTYAVAPLYNIRTSHLLTYAYRAAYKVVAISRITQNNILKKVPLSNIVVITPGIEPKSFDGEKSEIQKNVSYVLGVGGLKKRKGYHISLEAFGTIAAQFPSLHYYIVADKNAEYQAGLEKIILKYNISNRVKFFHNISDEELQKLYDQAELFILTPINTKSHHFEGFGLVYLEAARAGLPVIGTLSTGAEDAISNGYNGILVPQNDVTMTAEALESILSSENKKRSMSEASRGWANKNSIENQTKKFLALYEMSE